MLKSDETDSNINLHDKLQQVKKLVLNLLSSRLSPNWQVKTTSTKYNKMLQIQKQNNVLTYEFGLLANLLHNLAIHDTHQIFVLNKQIYDQERTLREVVKEKDKQLSLLQTKMKEVLVEKDNIQKQYNKLSKNFQICQKKLSALQGNGAKTKINQLQTNLRQLHQKYDQQSKQTKRYKDEINKLRIKCTLLQQLNHQTQNKVSNYLVEHNKIVNQNKQNNEKQNENLVNYSKQIKNYRLEYMSAKEELKCLKLKISQLQNQKNKDKIRGKSKGNIEKK